MLFIPPRKSPIVYLLFFVAEGQDEGAVVGTTLGKLALESNLDPIVTL